MSKAKRLKNAKLTEQEPTKDKSPHVPQDKKLDWKLNIRVRHELTDKQKKYLEVMTNKKTNIVFLKGPAGTSKSYLAVLAGLQALDSKTQSDVLYIRAPIEVGKGLGFTPGEIKDKVAPYLAPLYDKVEEFVSRAEADKLVKEERIMGTVPNYLRGASWNAKFVIVDESQNLDPVSLLTIITRLGKYSKIIFLADEKQSDIRGKIEFIRYFDLFNSEESQSLGIHCLSLGKEDIVRHPILGYILDKIEGTYTPPDKSFSMFECK